MEVLDKKYPEYCFSKHKGYGTKLHTEKIKEFGPCPEHRMSFLGKILGDRK
jgi:ribonuclease HII